MTIKTGDRLPEATFKVMTADGPALLKSDEIFSGKTVVLFGVPGAFTPTCHNNHLPGFVEYHDTIKAKGVDTIAVLSVNDVFVMDAWADATHAKGKILFLADDAAGFTNAIDLQIDASVFGNIRTQRFALIAKDGIVTHMAIEEQRGAATNSGAAAILAAL